MYNSHLEIFAKNSHLEKMITIKIIFFLDY